MRILKSFQRFVVLSFDEIKIQQNLVFDKHSGELIGYVDLRDPEKNFSTFDNDDDLVTNVMMHYVRGLVSDLKFALGYFKSCPHSGKQFPFWNILVICLL